MILDHNSGHEPNPNPKFDHAPGPGFSSPLAIPIPVPRRPLTPSPSPARGHVKMCERVLASALAHMPRYSHVRMQEQRLADKQTCRHTDG
eukprot:4630575-Alexandrium_andersonii.AAC.1